FHHERKSASLRIRHESRLRSGTRIVERPRQKIGVEPPLGVPTQIRISKGTGSDLFGNRFCRAGRSEWIDHIEVLPRGNHYVLAQTHLDYRSVREVVVR